MAAWRYEISLRVLKNTLMSEIFFSTQEEEFPVSKQSCNVLFII